jgi:hypothetical protein
MPPALWMAVYKDKWEDIVNIVFGETPVCPEFKAACLAKDMRKAKQEHEQGAFAEYTYLWSEEMYPCICGLGGGCSDNYSLPQNEKPRQFNMVLDYGLIDIGFFPEDYILVLLRHLSGLIN